MTWKERAVEAYRQKKVSKEEADRQQKAFRDTADGAALSELLTELLGEPISAASSRHEADGLTFVLKYPPQTLSGGAFGQKPATEPPKPYVVVSTVCPSCDDDLEVRVSDLAAIGVVVTGDIYCRVCAEARRQGGGN